MRTKIIIIFALGLLGAGVTWLFSEHQSNIDGFDQSRNVLPSETKKVLNTGERFVLLSLDPRRARLREESGPQPQESFHKYAVLGKTEIRDARARSKLLRALYQGIENSHGIVAECFNPRHGISATLGDETVDLVICFECMSIETHAKAGKSVLTTRSPERTFNRALKSAGLPIAKEK